MSLNVHWSHWEVYHHYRQLSRLIIIHDHDSFDFPLTTRRFDDPDSPLDTDAIFRARASSLDRTITN